MRTGGRTRARWSADFSSAGASMRGPASARRPRPRHEGVANVSRQQVARAGHDGRKGKIKPGSGWRRDRGMDRFVRAAGANHDGKAVRRPAFQTRSRLLDPNARVSVLEGGAPRRFDYPAGATRTKRSDPRRTFVIPVRPGGAGTGRRRRRACASAPRRRADSFPRAGRRARCCRGARPGDLRCTSAQIPRRCGLSRA